MFLEEAFEINEKGGKQSEIKVAFHLLPAKATLKVAEVLHEGFKKYGKDNWRLIPSEDHLNHALYHVFKHLEGEDVTIEHITHFACRALMALEMYLKEKNG